VLQNQSWADCFSLKKKNRSNNPAPHQFSICRGLAQAGTLPLRGPPVFYPEFENGVLDPGGGSVKNPKPMSSLLFGARFVFSHRIFQRMQFTLRSWYCQTTLTLKNHETAFFMEGGGEFAGGSPCVCHWRMESCSWFSLLPPAGPRRPRGWAPARLLYSMGATERYPRKIFLRLPQPHQSGNPGITTELNCRVLAISSSLPDWRQHPESP